MTELTYDFTGRVAVVTGGAKGIGAEIARRYRGAGAEVVIWDLEGDEPVDVADRASVEAAAARALAAHGKIDILSHNAGFAGPTVSALDYDPATWARIVEVNLTGTFHVNAVVAKAMKSAGYGRIVNMASLAGKEGTPNASAYSAAKAGVIGFTKSLAKELAETEVRVNAVAPAAIATEILDQMTPEFVQIMVDKSPMKRLGAVEEAAEIVMWLSSDATTFNTGAVFDLSGGRATY